MSAVYGGVGLQRQARDAARSHVIVATPGRLEDLLERRAFSLDEIKLLVLDEADRMLDMGFRPAVERIVSRCPKDRQTLFFSATLTGEVGRLASAYTRNPARLEHEPAQRADVEHRFVELETADGSSAGRPARRRARADARLRAHQARRRQARQAARDAGVKAVAMHGDKSQGQRERALASFERAEVRTLVATDVAARGIDVDGISHVINFDPPEDRDAYVHRVGRTGRAGRRGVGITFHSAADRPAIARLARELGLEHRVSGHAHTRPASTPARRAQRARAGRPRAGRPRA